MAFIDRDGSSVDASQVVGLPVVHTSQQQITASEMMDDGGFCSNSPEAESGTPALNSSATLRAGSGGRPVNPHYRPLVREVPAIRRRRSKRPVESQSRLP